MAQALATPSTAHHGPGKDRHASLTTVITRGRLIAMWVVALMVFAPTIYGFGQHIAQASWADWLALLAATAPLSIAVANRGNGRAAAWFFAASFMLLCAPLVPLPYGAAWIPVLNIGVAVCGGAALTLRPWPAAAAIGASSVLIGASATQSPPSIPLGAMPVAVPVLLALLCGVGFVLFMAAIVRTAGSIDERASRLREAEAHELSMITQSQHRAALDRRIHETVLNTLQALSMGVGAENAQQARDLCAQDLDSLTRGPLTLPATHADDLVASVVDELRAPDFSITCDIAARSLLQPFEATALRDALVEALRNCLRHSKSDHAQVRAVDDGAGVIVEVTDMGVGFSKQGATRFGIEHSMVRGLWGIGGDAQVTALDGGGTVVRLRVPHSTSPGARALDWPFTRMATESGWARLGLVLIPCALIPWSAWIGDALSFERPIRLLSLAFVALVGGVALLWDGPLRIPLAVGALAMSGALLVVAAIAEPTCAAEVPIEALIAAATGTGLFLPIVALPGTVPRSLAVACILALSLVVAFALPSACREAGQSVIDATAYLSAWVLTLAWLDRLGASRHADAEQAWRRIMADQAVVAEEQARLAGWARIDDQTRDLLACLASGDLPVDDDSVRDRAAVASARTRERLMGADDAATIPLSAASVLRLLDGRPRIVVHGAGSTGASMPDALARFVASAIGNARAESWSWRIGMSGGQQDHVLVGPAHDGGRYPLDPPALDGTGWTASIVTTAQQTSILIRRSLADGAGAAT